MFLLMSAIIVTLISITTTNALFIMKFRAFCALAAFAVLSLPSSVQASGSAPARRVPPKKPAAAAPVSPAEDPRYAIGQQVYDGKAPQAKKVGAAASQQARLAQAGATVGNKKKAAALLAMAGKLSEDQLTSLEYFVAVRFRR